MAAASSTSPKLASAVAVLADAEQRERTSLRRQSTRSRGLEISAMIDIWTEGIADRPVLKHEEEMALRDLAETSLRGPKQEDGQ